MLRIAVAGASGRMGRMLVDAVDAAPDAVLAAALDRADAAALGTKVGAHGIEVGADLNAALSVSDVLIDFTRPEATHRHLAACLAHRTRLVVGTTGFDAQGVAAIEAAAGRIGIVFAPNMSVGVNVLFRLIADASRALADGYDVEIVEAHHRNKVDAPSGTALRIGEIVADATGRDFDAVAAYGRHGRNGARDGATIGFSAIRGGDIVGDHTVLFAGVGERIEITHRASSREGYAHGSLLAARFLAARGPGLFDMQDVLGLR